MDSPDWPPGEQHSGPSGTSLHSLGGLGMDTSLWTNTAVLETMSSSSQTSTVNKEWTHTDIAAWSGVQWSALTLTSPHAQSSSIVAHPSTTIYKRSRTLLFCFCLTLTLTECYLKGLDRLLSGRGMLFTQSLVTFSHIAVDWMVEFHPLFVSRWWLLSVLLARNIFNV